MGKPGPTDVLAFPIDAPDVEVWPLPGADQPRSRPGPGRPGDLPLLLGDVVVCPAVAAAQAPDHAGTVDDELALLVVHGVLHVLGYDHAEDAERAAMRARELRAARRSPLARPGAGRVPPGARPNDRRRNSVAPSSAMLVDDLRPAVAS